MENQPALEPYLSEVLAQRTKDLVIAELRYYFRNVSLFGNPNNPIKMPMVKETYSLDMREYPAVLVNVNNEETINVGIGQDYAEDVWSDDQQIGQKWLPGTENFKNPVPYKPRVIAERSAIVADVTLNLRVIGDTTVVRNKVASETILAIRKFQRQSLLNQGIQLLRCNMGAEGEFTLNATEKLFIANISLVVNAETYIDTPVSYITAVNGGANIAVPSNDDNNYVVQPGDLIP